MTLIRSSIILSYLICLLIEVSRVQYPLGLSLKAVFLLTWLVRQSQQALDAVLRSATPKGKGDTFKSERAAS